MTDNLSIQELRKRRTSLLRDLRAAYLEPDSVEIDRLELEVAAIEKQIKEKEGGDE